jgi:hypothetical protein
MFKAVKDVAEGDIFIEELTAAFNNAVRDRFLHLADQGAFHNVPEEPSVIELDMAAFNRSARAIAAYRERIAALMRNARPPPSANINLGVSSSSVEDPVPSSPIAEP